MDQAIQIKMFAEIYIFPVEKRQCQNATQP